MSNFEKNVPGKIKDIVNIIRKRYVIRGVCDAMCIANVIGHTNGIGDGEGTFWGEEISKPDETADRLLGAYGCNIFAGDRPELVSILKTGELDLSDLRDGLMKYVQYCEDKKKISDPWYGRYLDDCISEAKMIYRREQRCQNLV